MILASASLSKIGARPEKFRCAEDAWFWTCESLRARQSGERRAGRATPRPCDPDDVLICLERLVLSKKLLIEHANTLGQYGMLGFRPTRGRNNGGAEKLWADAILILGEALAAKGIVAR
jgi:hypothetical protein